ncbi:MAG: S-layer homology domain-containing protein [Defluviitaleaceae bacterium]|nr:S-layer homology domain-containing protein [Defluviitaleaceae bacterium]
MKRSVGFILCFLFAAFFSAGQVFAAGPAALSAGQNVARPGDVLVLPVLLETNPGLANMILTVEYDRARLRLAGVDSVTQGEALYGLIFVGVDKDTYRQSPFRVGWVGHENNASEGVLIYIEFTVLNTAPGGFAFVRIEAEINDAAGMPVSGAFANGGIYVAGPAPQEPADTTPQDPACPAPQGPADATPQDPADAAPASSWPIITPGAVYVLELSAEVQTAAADNFIFAVDSDSPGVLQLMSVDFERNPEFLPESIVAYHICPEGSLSIVMPSFYANSVLRLLGLPGELYMVAANEVDFYDVSADAWYHAAVSFAAARLLFSGVGNNLFAPQMNMTRGMFVSVLSRLEGINPDSSDVSPFADVDINAWYAPGIAWAFAQGILPPISGLSAPHEYITREEMAVIFANYISARDFPLVDNDAEIFYDMYQAEYWARDAIHAMRRHAIIHGVGNNLYNPRGVATRAEVAQIFKNLIKAMVG